MALPFSYEGKRVVVSGGGGAGMGAAAVEGLAELGAEIHVLDLKDPPVDGRQPPDRRPARPRRRRGRHRQDRRADRLPVQRRRPARSAVPRRRHDARELRRAATPHVAGGAAHDERRGDLQHLLDRRQRLPPQPGEVDAAGRHQGLRGGEGVVRGAPRRHPGRVPAVEGSAHHLDDEGGDGPQRAGHPAQLHQPRPDRHTDDAGVRRHRRRRRRSSTCSPRASAAARRRPSRAGR